MERILAAWLPVAALPLPKTLAQPWGDAAEQWSCSPSLQGGLTRLPPPNWEWMELHPQLHKALKQAGLISYSKDDLLGKQCVIPCKWCCHWSVNSLWGLSCLGINQMLQPPQNTNCCAKLIVKSRRAKCWILCTIWIGLEHLWEASHGWAKSSLTLFFFTL